MTNVLSFSRLWICPLRVVSAALTRNLRVGSATALVLDGQVGTGEAKLFSVKCRLVCAMSSRRCAMFKGLPLTPMMKEKQWTKAMSVLVIMPSLLQHLGVTLLMFLSEQVLVGR